MSNQEERLNAVEKRLEHLEKMFNIPKEKTPKTVNKSETNASKEANTRSVEIEWEEKIILFIQKNWPAILGFFFILCGLGWLLTYGFLHDWLTKTTWFSLYLLGSASIYFAGYFFISRKKLFGELLVALGSACAILSLWGSMVYDLFPYWFVLSLLLLLSSVTLLLSIPCKSQFLASLSMVTLMLVPLLLGLDIFKVDIWHLYFCVTFSSALFLLFRQKWPYPIFIALMHKVYFLDGNPIVASSNMDQIYYFAITIPWCILFCSERKKWQHTYWIGTIFLLYANCWHVLQFVEVSSITLSGISALSLFCLYKLFQRDRLIGSEKLFAMMLSWMAIAHIGFLTERFFDGSVFFAVYLVEITAVIGFALFLLNAHFIAQILSYLYGCVVLLSFLEFTDNLPFSSFNYWLLFIISSLSLIIAKMFHIRHVQYTKHLISVFSCLATLYALYIVWVTCHNVIYSAEVARMVALIIYSISGLVLSFVASNKFIRSAGMFLIGAVAFRLLLIEMSYMTMIKKIITFVSIGCLFLASALIDRKKRKEEKAKTAA